MRVLLLIVMMPLLVIAQTGQITVRVTDFDSGQIITNAEVHAGFNTSIKPGWGWGGGKPNREVGYTGTNGLCTLTGSGNSASVGVATFKDGYYGNSGYSVRFTGIEGTLRKKWQPWNPTVDVVMKKIGNPIPLYAKKVRLQKMPVEGKPVGFDLMEGDWVPPYGAGKKSDIIFTYSRGPESLVETRYGMVKNYDCSLYVTFPNEGDGVVSFFKNPNEGGSSLRLPRMAPDSPYEPQVHKHYYRDANLKSRNNVREDQNYFFRVRTVLDDDGNVKSALYGKIHGDFQTGHGGSIGFQYYLNPTPDDRNLEFDRDKNLFSNERVMAR